MNRVSQWKLIGGFILVFIAGGITGAFFGGLHARHVFFEFHHPELIGIRMKEELRKELNLTPEQVAKISPIIDKTAAQLKQIRRDTGRRVHEIMMEAHREMAANLTDEQRLKLQQIADRHRHRPRISRAQILHLKFHRKRSPGSWISRRRCAPARSIFPAGEHRSNRRPDSVSPEWMNGPASCSSR